MRLDSSKVDREFLARVRCPTRPLGLLDAPPRSGTVFFPCEPSAALRCESLAEPATPVRIAEGAWAIVTRHHGVDPVDGVVKRDTGGVRYYEAGGGFVDDPEIGEDVVCRDSYYTWFVPRLLRGMKVWP